MIAVLWGGPMDGKETHVSRGTQRVDVASYYVDDVDMPDEELDNYPTVAILHYYRSGHRNSTGHIYVWEGVRTA